MYEQTIQKIVKNEREYQLCLITLELLTKALENLPKIRITRLTIDGDNEETDEKGTLTTYFEDPTEITIRAIENRMADLIIENKKLYNNNK